MKRLFLILYIALPLVLTAQIDVVLRLEAVDVPGAPGVQSFAHAQWEGRWLIIGGRQDGLHQRQPFASFAAAGNNDQLIVLDPVSRQVWQRPVTELPVSLREQLQSTNMEHCQEGSRLILIGGYAYSPTAGDHITFPYLTVVDVPGLMGAIVDNTPLAPHFRQLSDERMAVTGGQLEKLDDFFYLVGGQRFEGRYNPHGPDHGPGFSQVYTDEIRRFSLEEEEEGSLVIAGYEAWHDEVNLHRRDYNMLPQIFPGGRQGFTAFSGVFQHAVDLPFLNTVDITAEGYAVNQEFTQYLSHYHSAWSALYSERGQTMHNLFFGGISQFFLDAEGNLTEDQEVPFVRTISRVSRFADGRMEEVKLPEEMPGLMGTGAVFFPHPTVPLYDNGVIRLDELPSGTPVLLGYLYGGIESTLPNVLFLNGADLSDASAKLLAVYLTVTETATGVSEAPLDGQNPLVVSVFPNPSSDQVRVKFNSPARGQVFFLIQDAQGKIIRQFDAQADEAANYDTQLELNDLPAGQYFLSISAGRFLRSVPFILDRN